MHSYGGFDPWGENISGGTLGPEWRALIPGVETEAVKLWVHIGTTCICIESHGVALESHWGYVMFSFICKL